MNKKFPLWIVIIGLQLGFVIYSFCAVFSKKMSFTKLISFNSMFCFVAIALCMLVYAVIWQQAIKRLALSVAYSNKAIVVVWGMIWGWLFFDETITRGKLMGALLVISGMVLYTYADKGNNKNAR